MNENDSEFEDSLPDLSAENLKSTRSDQGQPESIERTQIGPYKILQKIAEGGMGAVFLAEQSEPIRRRVALKLIKAGRDSEQIIARFEAERQALAMMDHANIARIFDAGTTKDRSPYFVMELVNGIPLTDYCDRNRLSIRERLQLFVPVCRAVQHAHTKGIIHRDLKPSNILVAVYDGVAIPKVIDFGLAKATEHQLNLTDKTMFTEFGQIVGTLQYMSPEQAEVSQLDVDTRTDIYSLGVILYELLTGSTPLDKNTMREKALLKILELIREEQPPRPSTRLSSSEQVASQISEQRRIEPSRLQKILRGELDWIVMKSLEKDRTRRYETANQFADDIHRFLDGSAVFARPPSTMYRVSKFIKQNFAAVITALMLILILIAATVVSVNYALLANSEAVKAEQQRKLAEREKDGQEKVTHLFANVLDAGDPVFGQLFSKYGGALGRAASMEEVVRGIADDELSQRSELVDVPVIRAQLLTTLGDIHLSYGDVRKAQELYQKAALLFQQENVKHGPELARNQLGLGTCNYLLGELRASESRLVDAGEIAEKALQADPGNIEIIRDIAFCSFVRAAVRVEFEDFEQVEFLLAEAIKRCESEDSKTLVMLGAFARLYSVGIDAYRRSVEGEAIDMAFFARLQEAVEGLDIEGTLFEPFLGVMTAETLATVGRDATPAYERLHQGLVEAAGEDHFLTLLSQFGLAQSADRFSDFETANRRYEEMIAFTDKHLGRNHSRFAMILQAHARLIHENWRQSKERDRESLEQAQALLLEAVSIRRKRLGEHRQTASSLYYLARVETSLKNYQQAAQLLDEAIKIREVIYGPVSKQVSSCLYRKAIAFRDFESFGEAVATARKMLEVDQQLLAENIIESSEFGYRQQFAGRILAKEKPINQEEVRRLLTEGLKKMKEDSKRYERSISDTERFLDEL